MTAQAFRALAVHTFRALAVHTFRALKVHALRALAAQVLGALVAQAFRMGVQGRWSGVGGAESGRGLVPAAGFRVRGLRLELVALTDQADLRWNTQCPG
ncbi:hypothetical protein FHU30_002521 [Actinomadura rupiterrae]|nr:hypothetical protein [Actinomadura rupiterrae]